LSSSQTFLFLNLILNHHFLSQLLLHLLTLLILMTLIQSEEQPKPESR
jgi:hypothetical protein